MHLISDLKIAIASQGSALLLEPTPHMRNENQEVRALLLGIKKMCVEIRGSPEI